MEHTDTLNHFYSRHGSRGYTHVPSASRKSVVICGCILKAALDIFKESINKMVDHSCDNATETKIREVVLKQQGVDGIDELKTRMFGTKMYVDIEILADGNLALYDAHRIAEAVHQTIENNFPQCKHCMLLLSAPI